MKTCIITFFWVVLLSATFSGCKKCYKCQALSDTGLVEAAYLDNCGSNRDYQAYKKLCEANLKSGQVCDCSEL